MISPTVGELLDCMRSTGLGGIVTRAIVLTTGTADRDKQLNWGEWLEVCIRTLYENNPAIDLIMAAGAHDPIRQLATKLQRSGENDELPTFIIGLADDCWWTWTGANAFYHGGSGDKIQHLGQPPLQMMSIDVVVLWHRCLNDLARFREEQNAENGNQAPGSEDSSTS